MHKRRPASALLGATSRPVNRNELISDIFSNGLPYSRKLIAHTSCVNALVFSSGEGRFLASAGDDLRIHLWDFHQEDVSKNPSFTLLGIRGIFFSLAFSATNQYLYSGGTDAVVLRYDTSSLETAQKASVPHSPGKIFPDHNDNIRAVTCHPTKDDIFMSASEDGSIRRHDGRSSTRAPRAQDTIQISSEITGVQYHPLMEHIFVTSDNHGTVCLRDERMAFGPLTNRTGQGIVKQYNTKLVRKDLNYMSNPEASSVTFDREGSKLAVTMMHYLPTIYSISDSNPIAVCSGKYLPDGRSIPPGERTYSNSCTMKHGSFGGPGLDHDEFYTSGSDDFRGYVWRIPSPSELIERRKEYTALNWQSNQDLPPNAIAFSEGLEKMKYIPVDLSTPLCRLTGHNSIVNTAIFHPYFPHIITSGIEKNIILHSPSASSPCVQNLELSPQTVRRLTDDPETDRHNYFRALGFSRPDVLSGDDSAEETTISMFDHIVRVEGEADVFDVRRWRFVSGASSDEEDSDEEASEEEDLASNEDFTAFI